MDKNYLVGFEEESKIQYGFVGRFKGVGWLVIGLMTFGFQIIPAVVCLLGIMVIVTATGGISLDATLNHEALVMFFQYVAVSLGTIGCFVLFVKKVEKRPFSSIGLRQSAPIPKYIKGGMIAVIMQLIFFCTMVGLGYAKVSDVFINKGGMAVNTLGYVLLFLVLFLFQGAVEEMMTRGWVLPILSKYYGVWPAILLTSLLFGGMHLFNDHVAILPVINIVLYGIFASLYAIHDGGLWGVFGNHAIWNWVMGNVFGFPISGTILHHISLFRTELSGPVLLTGGEFGPEGGLVITIILVVAIGITYRQLGNKKVLWQQQAN